MKICRNIGTILSELRYTLVGISVCRITVRRNNRTSPNCRESGQKIMTMYTIWSSRPRILINIAHSLRIHEFTFTFQVVWLPEQCTWWLQLRPGHVLLCGFDIAVGVHESAYVRWKELKLWTCVTVYVPRQDQGRRRREVYLFFVFFSY